MHAAVPRHAFSERNGDTLNASHHNPQLFSKPHVAARPQSAANHGHQPGGVTGASGACTLDELQHRLRELQQQRQLLKRPEQTRGNDLSSRRMSASGNRPRSATAQPVQAPRAVRRPSSPRHARAEDTNATHNPVCAVASINAPAVADPPNARPASARPQGVAGGVGGAAAPPASARPQSSHRAMPRGGFGPAAHAGGVPLFASHTTPRSSAGTSPRRSVSGSSSSSGGSAANTAYESHLQREAEKQARTAQLRRLIREGYGRLGIPPPTITPGTALEPLLYRQEKVLGKGAFGLVSLARSVVTGELVAMKTVDKAKLTSENLKKTVEHEIRILKRLRHGRVVKLYEVIETSRSIHLIMEYVDGGTVQHLVKKHKRIAEEDPQRILYQLVDAVAHCHRSHVCHRDLKLENFMLSRGGRSLKLIDFGLSVVWKPGQALFKSYGTPCYMAPEIVRGEQYQGAHVDVWSMGVALATMLTGSLPFQGHGDTELKKKILRGAFAVPEHVSDGARDLMKRMLTLKPDERIDLDGIRAHPWLSAYAESREGVEPSVEAPQTGATTAADEALDEGVMARLEAVGMEREKVEKAVRANSYTHEAACYEMLFSQVQAERSARLSERGQAFNPFNLVQNLNPFNAN